MSRFVESARPLFPGSPHRVVVACSGGADSVALLHLLWVCGAELGLDLSVLSCDHGLRPDSAEDANWVRHLAWSLGMPCRLAVLDVPKHAAPGESMEMAARRLRLKAYADAAREFQADSVALGHHLDDQAETVLLRLCRGTGPRGAGGMEAVSMVEGLRLVRPLLTHRRSEIRAFLERTRRSWREDSSNATNDPVRNRIRNEVLPLLGEHVNFRTTEHLATFAAQVRELDDWASGEAAARLGDCLIGDRLQLRAWREHPKPLRDRILLHALHQWGGDPAKLQCELIFRSSENLMTPCSEARNVLLAGLRLCREREELFPERQRPVSEPTFLTPGDSCRWAPLGRELSLQIVRTWNAALSSRQEPEQELTAFCRRAGEGLRIRAPKRGDRYQPLGMKGHVKLSDLFVNAGISRSLRARWPVWVDAEDHIVWVPGGRVAESWKAEQGACWQLRMHSEIHAGFTAF